MTDIIIYDTETTGVPKDYKGKMSDLDNWPRIIQFAWQRCSRDGKVLHEQQMLIRPDGWEIPKEDFWIQNGFTTEDNMANGIPMQNALLLFINDLNKCSHMVAHNLNFDYPIVGSEMIRYGKKAKVKAEKICTMLATVDLCQLPGKYGNSFKWPKLEELHHHLFGCDFEGAHDALNDVNATRVCLFELMKREVIVL